MSRRIITTEITEEDKRIETSLRPQYLKEYIGQEKIKSTLKIFIDAARSRGEALDHVLFYGPPGLGKTTLLKTILGKIPAISGAVELGDFLIPGYFEQEAERDSDQTAMESFWAEFLSA